MPSQRWASKPDAVIHAEVVTDAAVLDEIYEFGKNNPLPRWQFHRGDPPYITREQLQFYFDRGNPILVARDQDGEMWGARVNSKNPDPDKFQKGLWLLLRREADELHDPLPDGTPGLTENVRKTIAEFNALSWHLAGGPFQLHHPDENKNMALLNPNEFYERAMQVYREKYEGRS